MRDITRPFALGDTKANLIHGKTKIILTNVKDGSKTIVEHENTFQSAILAKQLRAFGKANASPWNNETWAGLPLWQNLVGGIFLFRDAIDNTGGAVEYMPASNVMVANGSFGVSNNATPTELGSYNSIESSTDGARSISFVYDWGTSQGNGTIGCVCLTSNTGGYIGYGNASGEEATVKYSLKRNQTATAPGGRFFYNGKRYSVSAVDLSANKVTITEGNDRVTVASIFQEQNGVTTEYSFTGSPVGSTGTYIFIKSLNAEEFAIISTSSTYAGVSLTNGSSGYVLVFNCRTKTIRLQKIANTTGKTLSLLQGSTYRGVNLMQDVSGNYYIADDVLNDGNLYKFDSSGDYVGVAATHANAIGGIGRLTPDLWHITPGQSSGTMWIFDGTNERPTNGQIVQTMGENNDYNDALDTILASTGGSGNRRPYKNPLYLATINNLESPVTKDSTQTMKVIYTLTEA